jgi:hypothetical protein
MNVTYLGNGLSTLALKIVAMTYQKQHEVGGFSLIASIFDGIVTMFEFLLSDFTVFETDHLKEVAISKHMKSSLKIRAMSLKNYEKRHLHVGIQS